MFMATIPTQVRIDEELKKQAVELFSQLGMDMSSARNVFKTVHASWRITFSSRYSYIDVGWYRNTCWFV